MADKVLTVKQIEGADIPVEVIAQAIVDLSAGVKKLLAGKLNEDALVLLIQHAAPRQKMGRHTTGTPYPAKTIRAVLRGLESLEKTWVRR